MTDVQGIIIGVDGVLVDSNEAHSQAWRLAMSEYGIVPSFEAVHRYVGLDSEYLLPASVGVESHSLVGQALNRRFREIFRTRFLPNLKPFPHAADLLRRLHEIGLRVIAIGPSTAIEAAPLLTLVDADEYIDAVATASERFATTSAESVLRQALRLVDLPPQSVVMVGDTPTDAEAAARDQIGFIGLRCGGWQDGDFPNAIAVYDSPADMLE